MRNSPSETAAQLRRRLAQYLQAEDSGQAYPEEPSDERIQSLFCNYRGWSENWPRPEFARAPAVSQVLIRGVVDFVIPNPNPELGSHWPLNYHRLRGNKDWNVVLLQNDDTVHECNRPNPAARTVV